MISYLADINVWIAIVHPAHLHHRTAREWFHALGRDQASMCRFTQLGFLRLLTNQGVMGPEVKSQVEAWRVLDELSGNARVQYLDEPPGVGELFRRLTQNRQPANKTWSDAYIGAIAVQSGLHIATFDRGFRSLDVPALVLGA